MSSLRLLLSAALVAALVSFHPGAAVAQTKVTVTVGMVVGGSGLHIPSYVAMDKGFFKKEGLDATWVTLGGKALVTAGLSGQADFVPIPAGGAVAALHGAALRYVVGQSLGSQW
ncbi:MAG: ABC transporter substrate-binding protein, partial [Stellaceae bacterium]